MTNRMRNLQTLGWLVMVASMTAFTVLIVSGRARWLAAAAFLAMLAGAMMASHTEGGRRDD
jgi:uncharacterized membrane protein YphA (DoxX/SURF4 family)